MSELGFVLQNGDTYLRKTKSEGHIEIARRIINDTQMTKDFEKSSYTDPVDYLIFVQGALKIGSRWGDRVIVYYPAKVNKKIEEAISEYTQKNYREDKVYPPQSHTSLCAFFHN